MTLQIHKVVSALPDPLEADAVYAVRTGAGFDLYVSDSTGSVAHKLNAFPPIMAADEAEATTLSAANPYALVVWPEA